ncbi:MAG TPA: PQQ-binding-like beta-propeller repeat protein, partial [Gaiellaceae bacterium]|nr:PQQ-binding-like beta-propeller repeat protein [Gaiellaceae bacterium]
QPLDVQWPMYGFQAARTRAVGYSVDPPFRTLWQFHAGSLVEFPPSIGYGRLYLATNSGKVLAVNEQTGKRAWKYVSGRCVAASPAVGPHGQVYAVFLNKGPPCNRAAGSPGLDGEVIMFGAGFGNIRWRRTIGPSESSPVQIGKLVVVGDWNGDVWAFQRGTGQLTWRFHTGGSVKGGVAYRDKRFYVGSYDGSVYCLSLDGKLIWRSAGQGSLFGGGRFYSTPAVRYGRVYIGSTDGKVYSFGAATGKLRWSRSTGGYVYASPAVAGGLVFIGSYSHRFYALDAATGVPRWTFTANGPISGSPTVVGRIVYFATLTGRTYGLDIRTGKQVWTFPDGEYSPVVAVPGRFFLVGQGTIYGMVPR